MLIGMLAIPPLRLRWLRQAGAVLLCAFSLFLWNEARAGENPKFVVETEGESLWVGYSQVAHCYALVKTSTRGTALGLPAAFPGRLNRN
jgi:hypothetical protein